MQRSRTATGAASRAGPGVAELSKTGLALELAAVLASLALTFAWVNMHRRTRYRQSPVSDINALIRPVRRTLETAIAEARSARRTGG